MAHRTDFLYLSEPDTIAAGVLDAKKCIDNAEEVFTLLAKGDYLMGGNNHNNHGMYIVFPKESEFPNMPPLRRNARLPRRQIRYLRSEVVRLERRKQEEGSAPQRPDGYP